jgi:hypothetical protein
MRLSYTPSNLPHADVVLLINALFGCTSLIVDIQPSTLASNVIQAHPVHWSLVEVVLPALASEEILAVSKWGAFFKRRSIWIHSYPIKHQSTLVHNKHIMWFTNKSHNISSNRKLLVGYHVTFISFRYFSNIVLPNNKNHLYKTNLRVQYIYIKNKLCITLISCR